MSNTFDNQTLATRIVAHLQRLTPEEQRAFIQTLCDHLEPMFRTALDFAFEMIPTLERNPDDRLD